MVADKDRTEDEDWQRRDDILKGKVKPEDMQAEKDKLTGTSSGGPSSDASKKESSDKS